MKKLKVYTGIGVAVVALTVAAFLPGCGGGPDCSQGANKTSYDAGYSQGQTDASNAWNALTKDQRYQLGFHDAYNGGYQRGYQTGYNDPQRGYPKGKSDGYAIGITDYYSQQKGAQDGSVDGYQDGQKQGQTDGYHDGYQDGLAAGYTAGQYSCSPGSGSSADDQNQCRSEGHDAAYGVTFNNLRNNDPDYKHGLSDGDAKGFTDGVAPGQTQGYSDGKADGITAGRADAYKNAYNNAYNNAKPQGYNAGYNDPNLGYGRRPIPPSITNGTGGEGAGFQDGYRQGRAATCPSHAMSTPASGPARALAEDSVPASTSGSAMPHYGYVSPGYTQLAPWAVSVNDVVVSKFVDHSSPYMTQAERDDLANQISSLHESLRLQNEQSASAPATAN